MKRSEVIAIITERFRECGVRPTRIAQEEAEYLLDDLEEAGMLPPFNIHHFYNDGDNADERMVTYRTWEKE